KLGGIRYPGPPEKPLVPPANLKLTANSKNFLDAFNTQPAASNPVGPKAFRRSVDTAKRWSDYYGRPMHYGEFGVIMNADPESRARWAKDCRVALDEAGFGWALWDWKAVFHYWNAQRNAAEPGMREALLPGAGKK